MTADVLLVLAVLIGAFGLFVSGRVKPDLIAMGVLVALVVGGAVAPEQAFAGFSSFAVVTIAGLMVVGEGLEKTGVVKWVAQRLEAVIHKRYGRLLMLNTAVPGVLSGFANIVAVASFFVPVILRLCKQMRVAQSRILLPMASAALIGANLTLIGASHNLVVSSLLERATGEGFAFFEFTAVGAAFLAAGLAYIGLIGHKLLPGREVAPDPLSVPVTEKLIETYGLQDRLLEAWVSEDPGEGCSIASLGLADQGLTLIALVRENEQLVLPVATTPLQEGDMLLLQGRKEVVEAAVEDEPVLTFLGPPKAQEKYPISTAELAEVVVPPRSPAVGQPVNALNLPQEFGMTPIALWRDGTPHRTGVSSMELREGDGLLVYGPREKMREFDPEKDLLIYFKPAESEVATGRRRMAPVAAAILLLVVLTAALDVLPIAATAVTGAVAMVALGIVPLADVYKAIEWRTLVLIAGIYPLGVALNGSGAADVIGAGLVGALGGMGPLAVLAGVAGLSILLTQAIHNAAVAVIMTPVALTAAEATGADPKGFAVAVVVGCSAAFLMPYGHPAPYLVQEPGGYSAGDYVKFGAGLIVLAFAVILGLVPLIWPL